MLYADVCFYNLLNIKIHTLKVIYFRSKNKQFIKTLSLKTMNTRYNFLHFVLLFFIILCREDIVAQNCMGNPRGTATRINNDCDYAVQLCVDIVQNGTKRIIFTLQYDTNGDGVADATLTHTIDPPGSADVPQGEHCHTFSVNNIICTSNLVASIVAYQGNGAGSDCGNIPPTIFSEGSPILPLELAQFFGETAQKHNQISWETTSEQNTARHILERSPNGSTHFIVVANVAAAGTSTKLLRYSVTDKQPLPIAYYRLRTIDLDGSFSVSPIIALKRNRDATFLELMPNPITTDEHLKVNIQLSSTQQTKVMLRLCDLVGNVLHTRTVEADAENIQLELDVASLPSGIYIVNIFDGMTQMSKKFIKK